MKLAAKIENLPKVLDYIQRQLEDGNKISSKNLNFLILAVDEIITNIINYAYPNKSDGEIEVEVHINTSQEGISQGVIITITDWGLPFDPLSTPAPDVVSSLEDRKIGGLGIHFIRKFVDNANYCRENNKNILTLHMSNSLSEGN